jgi:hypothetical protein
MSKTFGALWNRLRSDQVIVYHGEPLDVCANRHKGNEEVKCSTCGGIQTIGDNICPKCGGTGYDICANRHGGNTESVAAFETVKDSLTEKQWQVFKYIKARKSRGATVDEIACDLGKTPNAISGRVSELKRDGKIVKCGRRLTRSGCTAAVVKAV